MITRNMGRLDRALRSSAGLVDRSRALLAGEEPERPEIRFRADLHLTHYGMRKFAIEDPHGVDLTFAQPLSG